jgi:hypothetical protein
MRPLPGLGSHVLAVPGCFSALSDEQKMQKGRNKALLAFVPTRLVMMRARPLRKWASSKPVGDEKPSSASVSGGTYLKDTCTQDGPLPRQYNMLRTQPEREQPRSHGLENAVV